MNAASSSSSRNRARALPRMVEQPHGHVLIVDSSKTIRSLIETKFKKYSWEGSLIHLFSTYICIYDHAWLLSRLCSVVEIQETSYWLILRLLIQFVAVSHAESGPDAYQLLGLTDSAVGVFFQLSFCRYIAVSWYENEPVFRSMLFSCAANINLQ